MAILFWTALAVLIYTYLGYPIVLRGLLLLKRLFRNTPPDYFSANELPNLTLIVASYNEAELLYQKIENTLQLDYPLDKLQLYFVTDGSTDNSPEIIGKFPEITLFHQPERKGKNAAINRIMPLVKTPIVVYCDANAFLNKEALKRIARHYKNDRVGGVAGEKRIKPQETGNAAGSGEGMYWKYESKLKSWDSELNTVVGAAGELFSIRKSLYEEVPPGVLIEDFRLSMNIAKKGYKVVYEPGAFAYENSSANMEEEEKRKIRISAGGLIEVSHFLSLLNIFKYGMLTFQYVSHRMLRWTFAPISMVLLLVSNIWLFYYSIHPYFQLLLVLQLVFYSLATAGHFLRNKNIRPKFVFLPYYIVFMNLSVFQGFLRLMRGKQTEIWDKAKRAT